MPNQTPHVTIGYKCTPYPVEIVVRNYLVGHAWRVYKSGQRSLCGVKLPEGLKENDRLPSPIITPTTKASSGHDEDISFAELVKQRIVKKKELESLYEKAFALFEYGTKHANQRGLMLVDTKYEFGKRNNEIFLIDEIHTPDSSRYFYADGYEENQNSGKRQKQLSKEFVREWLIENGFQGQAGQLIPEMTDEFVEGVSNRYIELFEQITGKKFQKRSYHHIEKEIETSVNDFILNL